MGYSEENIFEIISDSNGCDTVDFEHLILDIPITVNGDNAKNANDDEVDEVDINIKEKENIQSEQKYLEYQEHQQYKEPWGSSSDIRVVDTDELPDPHPITDDVQCSKCGNNQARWWVVQTDSADEPSTQFFRCTKCKHTWRTAKTS
jgi:DNA-directed RNA polymerase subunit M